MADMPPIWLMVLVIASLIALTAAAGAALEARVVGVDGQPRLEVNGRPTAPLMVFVNPTSGDWKKGLSTVRRAAAAGVNIVSFVNHSFPMPHGDQEPDYTSWDRMIDEILAANPNALLLPRFGASGMPAWWVRENPNEMMVFENGDRGMQSMASDKWKRDAGEATRLLVRHLEQKYGDHMLGYHPCGQHTGEWFYDRGWENLMPSFEAPMETAFRAWTDDPSAKLPTVDERRAAGLGAFLDPVTQRRLIDFNAFQQAAMEKPLEYLAHIIKDETKGRKLVVLFYGYIFELAGLPGGPSVSGHLALGRLLECPDVDIICSPISYSDRQPGGAGMFMAPVDSVQLHGKLWLNEDDTRTYLSTAEDAYGRAGTLAQTLAVHDRNLARIAARGSACWWMDLPGNGWLDSDEIWSNCAGLKRIYETQALHAAAPYRPEVAVVVDEASLFYLSHGSQISAPLINELRRELYRIGVPLGFYLLSDVCAGKVAWPKVYIMLDAFAVDRSQREALARQVRAPGKTAVWFYAPGFIEGTQASTDLVSDLTGITVAAEPGAISPRAVVMEEARHALPGVRAGEEFGPGTAVAPLFSVTDEHAKPLASYTATGRTAAAIKRIGDATTVFIGSPFATSSLLREIARLAGSHIWMRSDDIVVAGNGLVAVHAASDGEKVIHLPGNAAVVDAVSGKAMQTDGNRVRLHMQFGETRIFVLKERSG
jgi:beta-galactosidase